MSLSHKNQHRLAVGLCMWLFEHVKHVSHVSVSLKPLRGKEREKSVRNMENETEREEKD